jgi:hypothetical protein
MARILVQDIQLTNAEPITLSEADLQIAGGKYHCGTEEYEDDCEIKFEEICKDDDDDKKLMPDGLGYGQTKEKNNPLCRGNGRKVGLRRRLCD